MGEDCKEMTTFPCRYGTFQFEFMPFGLMNAPSAFPRMIDRLFCDLPFVRVYLDDAVIFWKQTREHMHLLLHVFEMIMTHGLEL